jgi:hypothetical protein
MKPFRGSYDGDYHSISNIRIDRDSMMYNYVGLFGVAKSAQFKEIKITNADIAGYFSAGILIGYCDSITVQNCSVSGTIYGYGNTGGLAGYVSTSTISQCFSEADVTAVWSYAGGLIGYNFATLISNCYSSGSVEGDSFVGGLIGSDNSSQILYCYSTGAVSGTGGNIGGLMGYSDGYIYSCFWDTQTSGQMSSAGGEGKTSDDMTYPYDLNTFADWDFSYTPIWVGNSNFNNGYPYLAWENRTAPGTPQNLTITYSAGNVTLNWSVVSGAVYYKVYSSAAPYGTYALDSTGAFNGAQWTAPVPVTKKFYYVTAVNSAKEMVKRAVTSR